MSGWNASMGSHCCSQFQNLSPELVEAIICYNLPPYAILRRTFPKLPKTTGRNPKTLRFLDPWRYFYQTLKSCSLVCRIFALICRRIFYTRLFIHSPVHLEAFQTLVESQPDACSLIHYIQELHISFPLSPDLLLRLMTVVAAIPEASGHSTASTCSLQFPSEIVCTDIDWKTMVSALSGATQNDSFTQQLSQLSKYDLVTSLVSLHLEDAMIPEDCPSDTSNPLILPNLEAFSIGLTMSEPTARQIPTGNWHMPSLRSITLSNCYPVYSSRGSVTYLPFLQKYGSGVEHLFLHGVRPGSINPACMYLSMIQDCLDALQDLKHLVVSQRPWVNSGTFKLSHRKLLWLDYGVAPSNDAFLPTMTGDVDNVPRIRGGARTHAQALASHRKYVSPPSGWDALFPNLQRVRKVDFYLFPFMPSLTRELFSPYEIPRPGEICTLPAGEKSFIRHTNESIYLWIPDDELRDELWD